MNIHFVSLGCARNQVDSETMMGRLARAGHHMTDDPAAGEVIIVNTCSFIESAINESIDTILELAKYKTSGSCRRMIVAGCLPERFQQEIADELAEIDIFLGTGAFDKIVEAVDSETEPQTCILPDPDVVGLVEDGARRIRSIPHMAYLKIAEGCDKHCTYCIIPKLRGRQKSRLQEHILTEAATLIQTGVKELVLVAQDTTAYGRDLDLSGGLSGLLQALSELSNEIWIRVLYGHPNSIDTDVIRTIHEAPNICSYFDIPIQHASGAVLKRMGRHYSDGDLFDLFKTIRTLSSSACLRTTLIVGFPGETDTDFDTLMRFVERVRFDHLGVFMYSDSEDLPSHKLSGHVSEDVAKTRYDTIMSRQATISLENNRKYIGRTIQVLVDEMPEENVYIGRAVFQAPEVDGVTFIHAGELRVGSFADVRITDALEYDLIGEA
jgi:ribosomal protein S12 methylthiotransferase